MNRISKFINPEALRAYCEAQLENPEPESVEEIIELSNDEELVEMAASLADPAIAPMQALGLLIGLELFLRHQEKQCALPRCRGGLSIVQ